MRFTTVSSGRECVVKVINGLVEDTVTGKKRKTRAEKEGMSWIFLVPAQIQRPVQRHHALCAQKNTPIPRGGLLMWQPGQINVNIDMSRVRSLSK